MKGGERDKISCELLYAPKVGAGFLLWQERPRVMGGARRGDGDTPVFSGAASILFAPRV